jgi:hypothetical protein
VTGTGRAARASWQAGPVEIQIPLELRGDATLVTGTVLNHGPAVALVTFDLPPVPGDRRRTLGTVSGDRLDAGGRWTAELVPGRPFEVPPTTGTLPGSVDFALRPDHPWGASEAPDLGATITWDIAVGGAVCPAYFHVSAASAGLLNNGNVGAAVALAGLAGLIVWASYL